MRKRIKRMMPQWNIPMSELATINILQLPILTALQSKIDLSASSRPYFKDCQITANNDLEAVMCWLNKYKNNDNTFASYLRQTKLLLLWCCYEQGKTLSQLKAQDFEDFFAFLKKPPQSWCASRASLQHGKSSEHWRPLIGPLSVSAVQMTYRVLQSLMNYLVASQYLRANPLKLIKLHDNYLSSMNEQKYHIWARMLEEDEWEAVQQTLNNLPEANVTQVGYKIRAQFLFALLYFLGLRVHEVTAHTWSAFQYKDQRWWFFVRGKGGKLGHIPVHERLLKFVKLYRVYLQKTPLPETDDLSSLIVAINCESIQTRQIYNIVKSIGALASKIFPDESQKATKLRKLSPHWLRHLSASHQDKAGIKMTMIKENLRHSSIQTTQIYMHTEDKLRHQAIQQMSLKVVPREHIVKKTIKQTLIKIKLTKGPVHRDLGFRLFIEAIEEGVLHEYAWECYDFSKNEILEQLQTAQHRFQEISCAYMVECLDVAKLNIIKQALQLEGDIRLFNTEIITSTALPQNKVITK